jgi:hypothetical protein
VTAVPTGTSTVASPLRRCNALMTSLSSGMSSVVSAVPCVQNDGLWLERIGRAWPRWSATDLRRQAVRANRGPASTARLRLHGAAASGRGRLSRPRPASRCRLRALPTRIGKRHRGLALLGMPNASVGVGHFQAWDPRGRTPRTMPSPQGILLGEPCGQSSRFVLRKSLLGARDKHLVSLFEIALVLSEIGRNDLDAANTRRVVSANARWAERMSTVRATPNLPSTVRLPPSVVS